MNITALFKNEGAPATGLAPTVDVYDVTVGVKVVSAASMVEVGGGVYKYNFAAFDPTKEYATICDGGPSLNVVDRYATGGTTTEGQIDRILADTNEIQGDLADGGRLDNLFDEIKAQTDKLPADPASQAAVEAAISSAEGNIRAGAETLGSLRSAVDGVGVLTTAVKERTDRLPDDPASESNVSSVRAKTDNLPVDTAATLATISEGLSVEHAAIVALLEDAGFGLAALKALLDAIDTNDEMAARFSEIKGVGWVSETLVQINGFIETIKAKTDELPADAAAEMAAVRERTGRLPDDPASQSAIQGSLNAAEGRLKGDLDALADTSAGQGLEIAGIRTEVDAIRVKTKNLPVDTDSKLDAMQIDVVGRIELMQSDVSFIRAIEGGRWRIIGTQMVFFAEDNETEVARFDLLDYSGNPAVSNVFERRRA